MIIIGITGPTGSGKSKVSEILNSYGVCTIDTDKLYHSLLIPPSACLDELAKKENFGPQILCKDGTLDRPKLAEIVFNQNNHDKLLRLNEITHKFVLVATLAIIESRKIQGDFAVAVDAPLLFEAEFDKLCDMDYTLSVISDKNERLKRIQMRDSLQIDAANKRINSQPDDEFYISRSSYVIYNNGDINGLISQTVDFLRKVKENETKKLS